MDTVYCRYSPWTDQVVETSVDDWRQGKLLLLFIEFLNKNFFIMNFYIGNIFTMCNKLEILIYALFSDLFHHSFISIWLNFLLIIFFYVFFHIKNHIPTSDSNDKVGLDYEDDQLYTVSGPVDLPAGSDQQDDQPQDDEVGSQTSWLQTSWSQTSAHWYPYTVFTEIVLTQFYCTMHQSYVDCR